MPIKCAYKPNRSKVRFWTAKKAIQVSCDAIQRHGASAAAILSGVQQCAGRGKDQKSDEALKAMEAAALALEQSDALFDADLAFLERFLAFTDLSAIIFRIISRLGRAGKAAVAAVLVLRELATGRVKQLAVQRAANDATLALVRRAAANEAQFLRTGTRF